MNGKDEAAAAGFNPADVSSVRALDSLPPGSKGLVTAPQHGEWHTEDFKKKINGHSFDAGQTKLCRTFLVDEPGSPPAKPHSHVVTAAHLQGEVGLDACQCPRCEDIHRADEHGLKYQTDVLPAPITLRIRTSICSVSILIRARRSLEAAITDIIKRTWMQQWRGASSKRKSCPFTKRSVAATPITFCQRPSGRRKILAVWGGRLLPRLRSTSHTAGAASMAAASLSMAADLREVFVLHNED